MEDDLSDLPPEYLFFLQHHLMRQREIALSKVLADLGLTPQKWRVLSTLSRLGRCSMGQLADFCAVDRTTLTRVMDQMTSAALVERVSHAQDRRQTLIDLSPAGRVAYAASVEAVVRFNDTAMAGVEPEDAATLERVVRKVVRNVIPDDDWADCVLNFRKTA